jgi:hypothetical protein
MSLFSRFSKQKVKVKWEYHAIGQIWRILISQNQLIVGEDRDINSKQVSFFCVNSDSGEVLWEGKKFNESWWIELGVVQRNVILLHEFTSPDMPEHKRLIALEALTGKQLWENSDYQLHFAHEGSIVVSKDAIEGKLFYELNLENGIVIRELEHSYLNVLRPEVISKTKSLYSLPEKIDLSSNSNDIVTLILEQSEKKNGLSLEYAEYWSNGNIAAVCYYQNISNSIEKKMMKQCIKIFDVHNQKLLYKDVLISDAVVAVPDSFFYLNGKILFVKSRTTLKAVQVESAG